MEMFRDQRSSVLEMFRMQHLFSIWRILPHWLFLGQATNTTVVGRTYHFSDIHDVEYHCHVLFSTVSHRCSSPSGEMDWFASSSDISRFGNVFCGCGELDCWIYQRIFLFISSIWGGMGRYANGEQRMYVFCDELFLSLLRAGVVFCCDCQSSSRLPPKKEASFSRYRPSIFLQSHPLWKNKLTHHTLFLEFFGGIPKPKGNIVNTRYRGPLVKILFLLFLLIQRKECVIFVCFQFLESSRKQYSFSFLTIFSFFSKPKPKLFHSLSVLLLSHTFYSYFVFFSIGFLENQFVGRKHDHVLEHFKWRYGFSFGHGFHTDKSKKKYLFDLRKSPSKEFAGLWNIVPSVEFLVLLVPVNKIS